MADSSNEISDNFFFIAAFVVRGWEFNFLYKKINRVQSYETVVVFTREHIKQHLLYVTWKDISSLPDYIAPEPKLTFLNKLPIIKIT